jgi:hypothetical protein
LYGSGVSGLGGDFGSSGTIGAGGDGSGVFGHLIGDGRRFLQKKNTEVQMYPIGEEVDLNVDSRQFLHIYRSFQRYLSM